MTTRANALASRLIRHHVRVIRNTARLAARVPLPVGAEAFAITLDHDQGKDARIELSDGEVKP